MLNRKSITLIFLAWSFASIHVFSQDRCATVYLQKLQDRPADADVRFEQWLKSKQRVTAQDVKETADIKRRQAAYTIPVVVHIIHNGEGHVTNIPDEQVISQIRVLNEDFNRLNADASQTPSDFLNAAGALDIEFALARRTPDGLPTNGINRVLGTKAKWKVTDNYELKSLSYWPAEDYLNIWVCDLESYLGYAQFPTSSGLDGLENASTNRLTDGVVIVYDAFGSIEDGNFSLDAKYNKGRTATHEIGHFLGLRHISGDDEGTCGNDGDYVSDTPDQASQTYNCPSHPQTSCSQPAMMFQNFLDYTNDACMNIFTKGQVSRMQTVLENSPRRKTLITSSGATEPEPVANDLGIKAILSPWPGECQGEVTPGVQVRNYGNNTISAAEVTLYVDGVMTETLPLMNSLSVGEEENITFAPVAVSEGTVEFSFEIQGTNGGTDGNVTNNALTRMVLVPSVIETPFAEMFNSLPSEWITYNPDELFSWEITNTTLEGSPNMALTMNFFDYADSEGEIDAFITPVIDLQDAPTAVVLFDVAHARYQTSNDGLRVILLSDCNSDLHQGVVLYDKSGAALATAGATDASFSPTLATHWRTETLDLSPYIGQRVQLAFVGLNDYGNNLYLDNIRAFTQDFANLSLLAVNAPYPVNCAHDVTPKLVVRNAGSAVSSFDVRYTVNGQENIHSVNAQLNTGAELELHLPAISLSPGLNDVSFALESPNGTPDEDPSDNTKSLQVGVSGTTGSVPFRLNFEDNAQESWFSISPQKAVSWQEASLNGGDALQHPGFTNGVIGSQAWFVSPVMDFSTLEAATLFFDVSYKTRNQTADVLEVRASTACGEPFDVLIETLSTSEISSGVHSTAWKPGANGDWKTKEVALSSLIGSPEVRIAFVVTNNNTNNMYLDNIELFLSDDPTRIDVDGVFVVYPNPSTMDDITSIAFNFPEIKDVVLEITDNLGKVVHRREMPGILNQVVELPVGGYTNGMYHVRISYDGRIRTSKLVVTR